MKRILSVAFAAAIMMSEAAFCDMGTCPIRDGHWGWGGSYQVAYAGGLALYDSGPTLLVADWSDPSTPRITGSTRLSGEPAAIDIDADIAVTASFGGGIDIIDISNPDAPFLIGFWHLESPPRGVAADRGHAFVTDYDGNLRVINIEQPHFPDEVAVLAVNPHGGTHDIAVGGQHVFIGGGNSLIVVDVTDPSQPFEAARVSVGGFATRLALDGPTAWLLGGDPDLVAIDISNPLTTSIVSGLDFSGPVQDVDASEGNVFVTGYGSSLHIVDGSDPTQPILASTVALNGWTHSVVTAPWGALVTTGADGVSAVETGSPTSPSIEGQWSRPGPATDLADAEALDELLVLADRSYGSGRIRILDATDRQQLVEIGRTDLPADCLAVDLLPGLAVTAHTTINVDVPVGGGVTVVDVADPTSPVPLVTLNLAGYVDDVVTAGTTAFALHNSGITVVDLSVPDEPEEISRWEPEFIRFESVEIDASLVFAGGGSGEFCAADAAVPSAPVHLGCTQVAGENVSLISLDVLGSLVAAVADPGPGDADRLFILDVSDPVQPVVLANVPALGDGGHRTAGRVLLFGNLAAVSFGYSSGVQIYDISDPTSPRAIGQSVLPSYSSIGMVAVGENLFVAAGQGGLDSYRLDGCRRPRRSDGRRSIQEDNPFSPNHHPAPGN